MVCFRFSEGGVLAVDSRVCNTLQDDIVVLPKEEKKYAKFSERIYYTLSGDGKQAKRLQRSVKHAQTFTEGNAVWSPSVSEAATFIYGRLFDMGKECNNQAIVAGFSPNSMEFEIYHVQVEIEPETPNSNRFIVTDNLLKKVDAEYIAIGGGKEAAELLLAGKYKFNMTIVEAKLLAGEALFAATGGTAVVCLLEPNDFSRTSYDPFNLCTLFRRENEERSFIAVLPLDFSASQTRIMDVVPNASVDTIKVTQNFSFYRISFQNDDEYYAVRSRIVDVGPMGVMSSPMES